MKYIAIAFAAGFTVAGSWQHNVYVFLFGCAWLVSASVLLGADEIASTVRSSSLRRDFRAERVGRSMGKAINEAAARGQRNKKVAQ